MAAIAAPILALVFNLLHLAAAKDNVALNRPVTAAGGWNSPSLANDGTVGESILANCFHSSEEAEYLPGWWRVDLGAVYPLDDVTIHFLTFANIDRSRGMAVYVQNSTGSKELCTTITESTLQNKNVSCPQTGQFLELRKTEIAPVQVIALCEVQVFVCPSGSYGPNCTLPCSHNCQSSSCDHLTGLCPGGLCKPGWTGAKCDQACSAGRFGFSCNSSCGSCYDNAVCDHVAGNCPRGCQAGWQAPYCLQECRDGTYGEGCTLTCGNCAGGVACDKRDGTCTVCQQGFTLPLCKAEREVTNAPSTSGSLSSQGNASHAEPRGRDDARRDRSVYNSAGPQAECVDRGPYEFLEERTRDESVPNAYEQIRTVTT